VDTAAAHSWIAQHVTTIGTIETTSREPWATVLRVPVADGHVWFKACEPAWRFEARLTATLGARWPDRVVEVLAWDERRGWLLLADAGTPMSTLGNPPSAWLASLPRYAELQRGEIKHAHEHLAHDVPDLRLTTMPARYEGMLHQDLPLEADDLDRLDRFAPHFGQLCNELATCGIADTVQHDDLHHHNLYRSGDHLRVLDWGDSSISHPFASLVVTFRFLEEINQLPPNDPWFARLRDAYLEPWGQGLADVFALALRVGTFAHAIASARQRENLELPARAAFDEAYPIILHRAIAHTVD
jgi:hypothetical protein